MSYYDGERLYRKRVHLLSAQPYSVPPSLPIPFRQPPFGWKPTASELEGLRDQVTKLQQQIRMLQEQVVDLEAKISRP